MILLNEPWSIYDRRCALVRRHQAAARALAWLIYSTLSLAIGFAAGQVIAYLSQ